MTLSSQQKRKVAQLAEYIKLLAQQGGYILIGVSDSALQKQIEKELKKLLPRRLWPRRFELFLTPTLLGELKSRQGQILSISNLDEFIDRAALPPEKTSDQTSHLRAAEPRAPYGSGAARPSSPRSRRGLAEVSPRSSPTDGRPPMLLGLNLHRDFFHENHIFALFGMRPETLYKVLPWKATDFWDGRAKSFLFESEKDLTKRPEKTGRLLQSAVSEYESAKELLQQRLSRETGTVKVADLVLQVARAARKAGRNVEARQQAESAVAQFRTLGEKKKLAEALAALAFVENDLGNPVQALQHHQQALEIYRELKDRQGEANQLGNIGLIYSDLDEPQKALKYHQEALQIQRELGNLPEVARQLGNIAESYLQENDFQKAGAAIAEALSLQGIEQFKSLHTWLLELKEKAGRQGANEPKKTRSQIAKGRQRRS